MEDKEDKGLEEAKAIGMALTDKILAWAEDPATTFASPSEQMKALYGALHGSAKDWERPQPCVYRGCTKLSIRRSHTLQRSGSLAVIAEAGHVLRPRNLPDKGVFMERVGVGEASTFAGFCEEHEGLFASFEATGVFATDADILRQVFRSVCREIVRRKFEIANMEVAEAHFNNRLRALAEEEGRKLGVEVGRVELTGGIAGVVQDAIADQKWNLRTMEEFYDDIFEEMNGRSSTRVSTRAFKIDTVVPVALSGFGMLNARGARLPCILGVAPERAETLLYLSTLSGHEALLDDYFADIAHRLVLLDRIEGWMIRGTDHWFIRPSVWSAIPDERKERILDSISDISVGIEADLPISIFDGLRRVAIRDHDAARSHPNAVQYIAHQREKLV